VKANDTFNHVIYLKLTCDHVLELMIECCYHMVDMHTTDLGHVISTLQPLHYCLPT